MVVDRTGRAYVTNFGYDAATAPTPLSTGIILVDPDGAASMQPLEVFRPNGITITEDGTRMIFAETRVHRLTTADIAADGTLSHRREFATLPLGTWADGISLDAEGGVWVADPKGRQCLRIEEGGAITDSIDTAPDSPLACMLGGPGGRTLFMTITPEMRRGRPPAGWGPGWKPST